VPTRRTVLICEDEPNLRELVRASLGTEYRFVEAASVAEADEALRVTAPDIAVLDLMLPGGSGLDILRAIRKRPGARIPAVIVSAWTTPDYRHAAEEAGADAFVAKPFAPDELATLVAGLLP
jgi:DNA-binding response OmpR family regulator